MFKTKLLEDIAKQVAQSLPGGNEIQQDVEKNLRTALQGLFSRLDLVTREEFEVQSAVLARTREKLEALERQVADMEDRARPDAPKK